MNSTYLKESLNKLFPNPHCELNYQKDYEILIATMLSAQTTDKRVNEVTKILFSKYDIFQLAQANPLDIEQIIRPVGTFKRKALYTVLIAQKLVSNYKGKVPNNREFLEKLPGVGHKTCNIVLSEIYQVPTIAVDTHVSRVTKRIRLVDEKDDVIAIEKKLMNFINKDDWHKIHLQLVLFGRYKCKAKKPECKNCPFLKCCQEKKKFLD